MQKKESEIVVICKIGDFNGLKQAESSYKIEQLRFFVPNKGTPRVRKIVDQDGTQFIAGLKGLSEPGAVKEVPETEDPVSSAFFEHFRHFADTLENKTRHIFPGSSTTITYQGKEYQVPPLSYEVDVFTRHDGRQSEWCKIDIDVSALKEVLLSIGSDGQEFANYDVKVSHLPFKPQMAFLAGDCSDEQKKALKELWEKEWTTTPFGKPRFVPESSVSQIPKETQQPEVSSEEAGNGHEVKQSA